MTIVSDDADAFASVVHEEGPVNKSVIVPFLHPLRLVLLQRLRRRQLASSQKEVIECRHC